MAKISKKELADLRASGAEVELSPERIVIEGLREQLEKLIPDNTALVSALSNLKPDNAEVLLAINSLIDKLSDIDNVSHNHNKVVIDTTPILEAVDRLTTRADYRFTVVRDQRGRIESMDARVI